MEILLISSKKRKRTASARIKKGVLEIRVPAWIGKKRAEFLAKKFLKKIKKKQRLFSSDKILARKAEIINQKYFDGKLAGFKIIWSKKMISSFGICSPEKKLIRISSRVKNFPSWVFDYLIIHELAHLVYPNHGRKFWQKVGEFPKAEQARGFLQGFNFFERKKCLV